MKIALCGLLVLGVIVAVIINQSPVAKAASGSGGLVYHRTFVPAGGNSFSDLGANSNGDHSTTLFLPSAYINVSGTTVRIKASGHYSVGSASQVIGYSVWTGARQMGTLVCLGDNAGVFKANGNSGSGEWAIECEIGIGIAGTSAPIAGFTVQHIWTSDCDAGGCSVSTGNNGATPLYGGSYFPGHDQTSTQPMVGVSTLNTNNNYGLYINLSTGAGAGSISSSLDIATVDIIQPVG